MKPKLLLTYATAFTLWVSPCALVSASEFSALATIRPEVKSRRVSSYDRSGGNGDNISGIADRAKINIMDVKGAGQITHILITLAPGAEKLNRDDIIIRRKYRVRPWGLGWTFCKEGVKWAGWRDQSEWNPRVECIKC